MIVIANISGYKIVRDYEPEDGGGMILVQEGSYTHKAISFVDGDIPAKFRGPEAISEGAAIAIARKFIANA